MKFFGFKIPWTKDLSGGVPVPMRDGSGGWWPVVREANTGWWQRGIEVRNDLSISYHAVFACLRQISSDVAKLRIKLMQQSTERVWSEFDSAAFSPVLRKPNNYQNRIQFLEEWVLSKLTRGNTYVLKERDSRGVVIGLRILHPDRCKPLVTEDGEIYYRLGIDHLAQVTEEGTVAPSSEIIHDRMNCIYHPLVGISPLYAAGLAASQGLGIQKNSAAFFSNGARPSGILTAPGLIDKDTANRIKEHWSNHYNGALAGSIAVLGDNLKYEAMTMTSVDAQLIEQLKWSAEVVCSAFGVPAYMVGLAPPPTHTNVIAMSQQYYSQCLQIYIECIELCLDEALGLDSQSGKTYGTELDLEGLIRMDPTTKADYWTKLTSGGLAKLNEGRAAFDLAPVEGGDNVFMQQQMFKLTDLVNRSPPPLPGVTPPAPPSKEMQTVFLATLSSYLTPLPSPEVEIPAVLLVPPVKLFLSAPATD